MACGMCKISFLFWWIRFGRALFIKCLHMAENKNNAFGLTSQLVGQMGSPLWLPHKGGSATFYTLAFID